MKSHTLARALKQLADIMLDGPNVEVSRLDLDDRSAGRASSSSELAVNIDTLLELSRVDKVQWKAFIDEYSLEVAVSSKDSTRNILGKVLSFLEKSEAARKRVKAAATRKSDTSPELSRALAALLND